MKAYTVELRERIVRLVEKGGSKVGASAHFKVGRRTVYRYLAAAQSGSLAPKGDNAPQHIPLYSSLYPIYTMSPLRHEMVL